MNYGHDEVPDIAILHLTAFAGKNLLNVECCYCNKEQEDLRILYSLKKFHHYCFVKEVCIITDHKPLVAIISKDKAMFSEYLQCIMLCIHQYRVGIIYKPCQDYT